MPVESRWLFYLITLSIPVLFFVLLEGGLRLADYGQSYPLFIAVDEAPGYLVANPEVAKRFVVDESRTPDVHIRPVPFPERKAHGTFRLFVQGGSTAAGWPYGFGASLGGMLQQRLQATFPQRNIEVITTAMTAVNSYTLLDFADEIVAQQPDAILIYAGHNEFLGILGVGSAVSAGRTRPVVLAYLALRDLRIFQLVTQAYTAVMKRLTPDDEAHTDSRTTLMRRIVDESHIPMDSPLFHQGLAQYQNNLAALLGRYRAAGIPVYIGTLASNEKGLEPFISGLAPGTDEVAWRRYMKTGREALRNGDMATARAALEQAVSLDDMAALGYFTLGKALERLEDYPAARGAYLAAKDRDQLRFRAPEVFNTVIREQAAEHGARVVEVQATLLAEASNGIIDNDLMLEHLHPNVEGYFLLSEAFYEALLEGGTIGPPEYSVPRKQARDRIPVTAVERQKGIYEIIRLKADWPFRAERIRPRYPPRKTDLDRMAYTHFKGSLAWSDAMKKLQSHYLQANERPAAVQAATLLADAYPYKVELQFTAGSLALEAGRPAEAERLLRRGLRHDPDQSETYRVALRRACQANEDEEKARQCLDRMRESVPDLP